MSRFDYQGSLDLLLKDLRGGNRRALAYALSLVESTAETDLDRSAELLEALSHNGDKVSWRIGVSGAPGVGKSSLLEEFGLSLIKAGHRVAVLAVDPSSRRTGGSILGDKLRMPELAQSDSAFVRPTPSRDTLGGTAETTKDAITVCEAAGYDVVIVETVGVGQSEVEAIDLVDLFVLLVLPNAGDDIQGIKRGIMEVADVVAVTKSDISEEDTLRAEAMYRSVLQLLHPARQDWTPVVQSVSALTGKGIDELMGLVDSFFSLDRRQSIENNRKTQRIAWFEKHLKRLLNALIHSNPEMSAEIESRLKKVASETSHPTSSAREFVKKLIISMKED